MQNRIYGSFIDSCEMKRIIVSVCKILPGWCRVVSIPKGNIVRCEGRDRYSIG